ncbi:MAG: DUF3857 domain-containing protein [Marinilabiliaceae bacterium]|jgi:hypothetical protein|nr:DUF3857 domain-containing protein [Marinilabiliaceae bacterium]
MRYRCFFVIILWSVIALPVFNTDIKKKRYPVSEIPESLTENAVAVVREYHEEFKISGPSKARSRIKRVVTVLNQHGQQYGIFNEWYSDLRSIFVESINIYNAYGELIIREDITGMEDFSSYSDYSLYDNIRIQRYIPPLKFFPYTVEVTYNLNYNGLLNYPTWQPVYGYDLAVQKSEFTIITEPDNSFRYSSSNYDNKPEIRSDGKTETYKWTLVNHFAVSEEENSPDISELLPIVYTAPKDFSIEEYSGNMESWKSFGTWVNELIHDRDNLTGETILKINDLIDDAEGRKEVIKRIYEYVQSKTRYVSIQEGIGGWQPVGADVVDKVGYGDCKALTNYTMTLLKAAGIESYYTRLRAGHGEPEIDTSFVHNFSNHIVLCVPDKNDTIWLECTDQSSSFNFLGSFSSDRYAMIIKPEGGEIVRTQTFSPEDNLKVINASVSINPEGGAIAKIISSYRGLQYESVSELLRKNELESRTWLHNNLGVNNIDIHSFLIRNITQSIPEISTELYLNIKNYASITGNRMFVRVNMLNVSSFLPERIRNRQFSIRHTRLNPPYIDKDTIRYQIPDGYIVESLPKDIEIKTQFGEYKTNTRVSQNTITYTRMLNIPKKDYPATDYNEFRNFFLEIAKSDNARVVLRMSQD